MLRMRPDWIVLVISLVLASASVVTGEVLPNPYRQTSRLAALAQQTRGPSYRPSEQWVRLGI